MADRRFAFECFADAVVHRHLRDACGLPLKPRHCMGQGEVVNSVLVRMESDVGMVDEDPRSSHHSLRDRARAVWTLEDVQLLEHGGRHLIVIRPALEKCFLKSMDKVGLTHSWGDDHRAMRDTLGTEYGPAHARFLTDLHHLREKSLSQGIDTFVIVLERAVEEALAGAP